MVYRYIIYAERGIRLYHFGAQVIGILSGGNGDDLAVASWAIKVSEKWPELRISYAVCGPPQSSSCW